MKLGEALLEKDSILWNINRIEEVFFSLNGKKNEVILIEPLKLFDLLKIETEKLKNIRIRINKTNMVSFLPGSEMTLKEALIQKEMLSHIYDVLDYLANSGPYRERPINELIDKYYDDLNEQYTELYRKIQVANWSIDLVD